jgi:hypothetical protein
MLGGHPVHGRWPRPRFQCRTSTSPAGTGPWPHSSVRASLDRSARLGCRRDRGSSTFVRLLRGPMNRDKDWWSNCESRTPHPLGAKHVNGSERLRRSHWCPTAQSRNLLPTPRSKSISRELISSTVSLVRFFDKRAKLASHWLSALAVQGYYATNEERCDSDAMLDCPVAREKESDDGTKNGTPSCANTARIPRESGSARSNGAARAALVATVLHASESQYKAGSGQTDHRSQAQLNIAVSRFRSDDFSNLPYDSWVVSGQCS